MDQGLQVLLEQIDSKSSLHNATIIITGDHTIFQDDMRQVFAKYCKKAQCSLPVEEPYSPIIIYSPEITGSNYVKTPFYQMDIYPTILSLIHCEDYFWHGFGVNMLDYQAEAMSRPISVKNAGILSDRLLRSNYFKGHPVIDMKNN